MSAGRICVREVDVAAPEDSVQSAAQRMHDRKVGTLVVVDEEKHPVGMLTDRDLAVRVVARGRDPYETTVAEVMTPRPRTIRETEPIESALTTMRSGSVRRLPVVNNVDELVGLLSLDDILDLLAEEFGEIRQLLSAEAPASLVAPLKPR